MKQFTYTCRHCNSEFASATYRKVKACSTRCLLLSSYVETATGCWEWTGARKKQPCAFDYGVVSVPGKSATVVHRVSYEEFTGPIPDGHLVRHQCDNPPCMNPDHLITGTHADNNRDTRQRGRFVKGNAKLTATEALAIYQSSSKQYELAAQYGVCSGTIWRIKAGRIWANETGHKV